MTRSTCNTIVALGLLSALPVSLQGCSDDSGTQTDATETSGDGDGEPATGDGDGEPTTGDGDGDPPTGDGDGDPAGDGDGDPTAGDGDGEPTTGDGDGDPAMCGDGVVDRGEECDDGNDETADGCLPSCELVTDCAQLLSVDPEAADGIYMIDPDGPGPGELGSVYCDMTTGGGGWTLVLIGSDDDTATWTWDNRALLADDTTEVGSIDDLTRDYKSFAYHQLAMTDLLFIHAPSGIWAEYDEVGDGTIDIGTFTAAVPSPNCDYDLAGNGFELSDGTLEVGGQLCDTDLYFNLGDHETSLNACLLAEMSARSSAAYGPMWSQGGNDGCPFDDPTASSLGQTSDCLNCAPNVTMTEIVALGFGRALGLNVGEEGSGENHLLMFVR